MNSNNFGLARGRLTRNPLVFTNKDGSRKVKFTLALQDNYVGKDGMRGSQFVSFDGFVQADKQDNGVYDLLHQGDLVTVHYTVRSSNYKDKNDATVYSQVLFVQGIQFEESKHAAGSHTANAPTEDEEIPF